MLIEGILFILGFALGVGTGVTLIHGAIVWRNRELMEEIYMMNRYGEFEEMEEELEKAKEELQEKQYKGER